MQDASGYQENHNSLPAYVIFNISCHRIAHKNLLKQIIFMGFVFLFYICVLILILVFLFFYFNYLR